MSGAWGAGSTRQWRKIRAYVLRRDGNRCQIKLEGCTVIATHAHHLDGKAMGDDPDRCVAACPHCNQKIGDPAKTTPDPEHVARTAW